jgi:hypothetical protein
MYFGATELILPAHVNIGTVVTQSVPLNWAGVGSMIVEVCAELDSAAAAAGYAVPVPPPASGGPTVGYAQMVGISKKGVAARVLGNVFPNLPGAGTKVSLVDEYRKEYQAALDAIRKGELPIVGAATDTSSVGRQLARSYSTSNGLATSGIVSQVTVGMEF